MDLQPLMDMLGNSARMKRAAEQMTLFELIVRLKELDPGTPVALGTPMSYRGYYSDLAFSPDTPRPAADVLADAEKALGRTFIGYKGGEFVMDKVTPVWVAEYGDTGEQLLGIEDDGSLVTQVEAEC